MLSMVAVLVGVGSFVGWVTPAVFLFHCQTAVALPTPAGTKQYCAETVYVPAGWNGAGRCPGVLYGSPLDVRFVGVGFNLTMWWPCFGPYSAWGILTNITELNGSTASHLFGWGPVFSHPGNATFTTPDSSAGVVWVRADQPNPWGDQPVQLLVEA